MPLYRVRMTVEGKFFVQAQDSEEAENLAAQLMDDREGWNRVAERVSYLVQGIEEIAT